MPSPVDFGIEIDQSLPMESMDVGVESDSNVPADGQVTDDQDLVIDSAATDATSSVDAAIPVGEASAVAADDANMGNMPAATDAEPQRVVDAGAPGTP